MNKKKISIGLNIIIIILEILGLYLSIKSLGLNVFIYYTQLSNLFLLIASILYLFKKYIKSRIVDLIKFGATLSVMITFLVVIFVLGPTTDLEYHWLLFEGSNLYYHLICPLLGLVTFLLFDDIKIYGLRDVFSSFIFTLVYSVLMIFLNLIRVVSGPYPFLLVYDNPIYESLFWVLTIDGGALLLGYGLEKIKNKI